MQIDLNGQVALVTGSAHRIGKRIAMALANEGVNIMVHYNSTDPDTVRDTMLDLKSTGVDVYDVQADISKPEGVTKVMDAVRDKFDKLDILVNSAAVFPSAPLLDVTLESWDLTMNINLRAPFLFTQQAARLMHDNVQPGGVIINICDQGADAPWPKRPHQGISKAALWMLTQVSALSLAPHIRVNALVLGPILKNNDGMSDEQWASVGKSLPLEKTGDGDDVGHAVVFLARQSFVSGAKLHVNGGEHLTYPKHDPSY